MSWQATEAEATEAEAEAAEAMEAEEAVCPFDPILNFLILTSVDQGGGGGGGW